MAESLSLDFGLPPVDPARVGPTGRPLDPPPIAGRSLQSRHASATGASAVVHTWAWRQSAYLQLMRQAGPLTDHEAAAVLKLPLSSINSVRGALEKRARTHKLPPVFVADGFDEHRFVDPGGSPRVTRRTRWRLNS